MGEYGLRLLVATLLGAVIGAERSFRMKDAGVRAYSIFSLGACLYMLLSKYAFFGAQGGADPTMIACQVVMGVNILCAGIIYRNRQIISRGLTSAAGVWATVGVGMACGCGLMLYAVIFTVLLLLVHILLLRFDVGGRAYNPQELKLTVENTPEIWSAFEEMQRKYNMRVIVSRYKRSGKEVHLILQVQLNHEVSPREILRLMDQHKEIKEFSL